MIIRLAACDHLIRGRTFFFRCGICHNELRLFKLAFSLIELVNVVLFLFLLDHELDAFVVLLYFVKLHLEPPSFTRQLLLLSLSEVDIPGPRIDSRLHSDALLSERLLAIVGHIHSCLGTTASHCGSSVIHHLAHTDFQLLLLCTKLIQLFNQHHVFFEDSSILLCVLGSFLRQLSL